MSNDSLMCDDECVGVVPVVGRARAGFLDELAGGDRGDDDHTPRGAA